MQDLGLEYLDLYLMHWPVAMVPNARPPLRKGRFLRDEYIDTQTSLRETWLAMEVPQLRVVVVVTSAVVIVSL